MASAIALVPALAGSLVIRTWTGIDGEMPDHIPVIGFSATTPNLVHAFGFSGHGFQLGPVVGEIIAELVTAGTLGLAARAVRDRSLRRCATAARRATSASTQ